jgi:prepilin-type N-terminal cleavage/methylation domain-containing protein
MKFRLSLRQLTRRAFTLPEVMVTVGVVSIAFMSLCLGMSGAFAITQQSRENLRATQIMLERLEGVRLYNWNQLCYSNMIPPTFTTYYYPFATNSQSLGILYSGTMTIAPAVLNPPASYGDAMRAITVSVSWTNKVSGSTPLVHNRSMTTYQSKNGVQNYIFNN